MKFEDFDEMLTAWGGAVRSVAIVDLLPPDRVKVTAWDYKDRRQTQTCERSELPEAFEFVYGSVEQWTCDVGHTRTPVL